MPKNNSEIADLDLYFNRPNIQEETKNFVKNWKSPNYEDKIDS